MMRQNGKSFFAKLMQSFGVVMIVLSLWLLSFHPPQSAERIITILNIAIGSFLIISGWYLSFKERKNKSSNSINGG